ncbi:unnamed protein product [Prorocentrum cordatum]|uniref:MFS transporter n=1 Tax=Prorocentrum cordatum TaxID=2364126 RepID=A0ABN9Q9T9_9DINO|nr:unnamed protein product [Polarella glacialis]
MPALIRRVGSIAATLGLHLLACVALLGLAAVRQPWAAAAAFLVFQVATKATDIPVYAITLERVKPEHRGKFFHVMAIKPLTFGASALLGGFMIDACGFRAAVATTGIVSLLLPTAFLAAVARLDPGA